MPRISFNFSINVVTKIWRPQDPIINFLIEDWRPKGRQVDCVEVAAQAKPEQPLRHNRLFFILRDTHPLQYRNRFQRLVLANLLLQLLRSGYRHPVRCAASHSPVRRSRCEVASYRCWIVRDRKSVV